jgi:hypothetical protein
LKLKTSIKIFIYQIWLWVDFLKSLIFLKGNNFYIYNTAIWHYGWDYQSRKIFYSKFVFEKKVIYINLNNCLMVKTLLLFKSAKQSLELSRREKLAFAACKWDGNLINIREFPCGQREYCEIAESFKKNFPIPKYAKKIKYLFSNLEFLGLIISQDTTDDWPWAILALTLDKPVIMPEGPLGFTSRKIIGDQYDEDKALFDRITNRMTFSDYKAAIRGLNGRSEGDYSKSSLSWAMPSYFKNKNNLAGNPSVTLSKNIIPFKGKYTLFFYMSCFGDYPNANIYDYEDLPAHDYYDLTLKIIDFFNGKNYGLGLKMHPNSANFEVDSRACLAINEKINVISNIVMMPENFKTADLKGYSHPIVLTPRGSVITECAALGIPTISFYKSIYSEIGLTKLVTKFTDLELIFSEENTEKDYRKNKKNAIKYEHFLNVVNKSRMLLLDDYNKISTNNVLNIISRKIN